MRRPSKTGRDKPVPYAEIAALVVPATGTTVDPDETSRSRRRRGDPCGRPRRMRRPIKTGRDKPVPYAEIATLVVPATGTTVDPDGKSRSAP